MDLLVLSPLNCQEAEKIEPFKVMQDTRGILIHPETCSTVFILYSLLQLRIKSLHMINSLILWRGVGWSEYFVPKKKMPAPKDFWHHSKEDLKLAGKYKYCSEHKMVWDHVLYIENGKRNEISAYFLCPHLHSTSCLVQLHHWFILWSVLGTCFFIFSFLRYSDCSLTGHQFSSRSSVSADAWASWTTNCVCNLCRFLLAGSGLCEKECGGNKRKNITRDWVCSSSGSLVVTGSHTILFRLGNVQT